MSTKPPARPFVKRSLRYHWRSHIAVVLACATATAVITGALLVGDSVRSSLRDQALSRLGNVEHAMVSRRFVRAELAEEVQARIQTQRSDVEIVGAILLRGSVTNRDNSKRATKVNIIGVDSRFEKIIPESAEWGIAGRSAALNRALADELSAEDGHTLILQFERASEISRELALGDRSTEEAIADLQIRAKKFLPDDGPGSFDLRNQQETPRNVFVSFRTISRQLDEVGRINTLFSTTGSEIPGVLFDPNPALESAWTLDDVGLYFESREDLRSTSLFSREFVLADSIVEKTGAVARKLGLSRNEVLTYLANTIAAGEKEIPYSTVTALGPWELPDGKTVAAFGDASGLALWKPGGIHLNTWADEQLGATAGDSIRIDYYAVGPEHTLIEKSASFALRSTIPLTGEAKDPTWTPRYPGVSDADTLDDWNPPFPVDISRFDHPEDIHDLYWEEYKATPKAYIAIEDGTELWSSRFGRRTSVRFLGTAGSDFSGVEEQVAEELRANLSADEFGLVFEPTRRLAIEAATAGTDFTMLFISMSFFIIVAALMLAAMTHRLALERRVRELGLFGAVGYPRKVVARDLLREGVVVATVGSALGIVGGVGYAAALITGLKTLWIDAVNTPFLALYLSPVMLVAGFGSTLLLAALTIFLVVRKLVRVPPRRLLAGESTTSPFDTKGARRSRSRSVAITSFVLAVGLLLGGSFGLIPTTLAFFLVGGALLTSGIATLAWRLSRVDTRDVCGNGASAVFRLGLRNARRASGRSLLTCGLIASATFIVVAVGASRSDPTDTEPALDSGNGGFAIVATTDVPLPARLETEESRETYTLGARATALLLPSETKLYSLRLRPGDETSCLNLYRPKEPRLLGLSKSVRERGGFRFSGSLAETDAEKENPWLLLEKDLEPADGGAPIIPAVGDFNTLKWILQLGLGDDIEMNDDHGRPVRLRIVGWIPQSILQGSLAISEEHFVDHFPGHPGWSAAFIECESGKTDAIIESLEEDLAAFGFDARSTGALLADFNRVQNTYLSTFLVLGGLGVLLGTLGLGAVLLRGVVERRGELALLRALGFTGRSLSGLILSETVGLLVGGLALGAVAALIAVAPNAIASGGEISWGTIVLMLVLVLVSGLLSAVMAVRAALRAPLLGSLRSG